MPVEVILLAVTVSVGVVPVLLDPAVAAYIPTFPTPSVRVISLFDITFPLFTPTAMAVLFLPLSKSIVPSPRL